MTEDEAAKLVSEVLINGVEDAATELEWIKAQRMIFVQEQRQLMAQFRMWKHARDDERMKAVAEQVRRNRELVTYLDAREKELNGNRV
jgi:hypothetical protein